MGAVLTPMMKQYYEIKQQAADCILFFRLGDFYEMFEKDALEASELLGITLTARSKGENSIPMCGVPYHAAAGYIAKLTRAGRKVAICEQASDPSLPGIVRREIVRIITPGTTLDEAVLDEKTSNYLASISFAANGKVALTLAEMSTGEFNSALVDGQEQLLAEFQKYKPREIIYPTGDYEEAQVSHLKKLFPQAFWHAENGQNAGTGAGEGAVSVGLGTNIPAMQEKMENHFGPFELVKLNLSEAEIVASAMALEFLAATQKTVVGKDSLRHLKKIQRRENKILHLDEATIRNLEILENAREKKLEGSLLGVLDKTITSSGGRLMKKVIVEPLAEQEAIEERLQIIDFLMQNQNLILDFRLLLKAVMDIERMLGRLTLGSGNARDLRGLINSFKALEELRKMMAGLNGAGAAMLMNSIGGRIDLLPELFARLEAAVVEEPPFAIREGGMIREGYNAELDELKGLSRDGKNFIQMLQAREIERTGINSLKVKFNKVFGYYIEISNANLAQTPADYTRKQTLANAERFSTPELKEYEEKILTAEEKLSTIELQIFEELREMVLEKTTEIKESAAAAAYLDVMVSLALVSWENRYTRPKFATQSSGQSEGRSDNFNLKIIAGRHPVIEKLNPQDKFIPNDTILTNDQRLILITGPNMGGKSTFLRQTAVIVLMAHLGMYVPADSAEISLVDRIFTRVGASDNLVKGQSTFWLEMEETATILRQATERSLIVLDEIGRGTSTFDGVSIAWGIMEFIHNNTRAKTLFASHYHELIRLADTLPHAANYSVKVEETEQNGVIFLYKIAPGGIDRSYGIEVARLAGLPDQVIARAKEILQDLEKEQIGTGQQSLGFEEGLWNGQKATSTFQEKNWLTDQENRIQKSVRTEFVGNKVAERSHSSLEKSPLENEALGKLKNLDLNTLSPLEALNKLSEIKKIIEE